MLLKNIKKFFSLVQEINTNKLLDFVVTSDFKRLDISVILQRVPIFYEITEKELEKIKKDI